MQNKLILVQYSKILKIHNGSSTIEDIKPRNLKPSDSLSHEAPLMQTDR